MGLKFGHRGSQPQCFAMLRTTPVGFLPFTSSGKVFRFISLRSLEDSLISYLQLIMQMFGLLSAGTYWCKEKLRTDKASC